MRKSLVFSALFHLALIVAIIFGVKLFGRMPEPKVTVVELVHAEDIAEKPAEKPPEPKPEPKPKPEPEPEKKPEPKPEKVADAPPRVEAARPQPPKVEPAPEAKKSAKPEPATHEIPNIRPHTKPRPPSKFDTARIAALLDKRQQEAKQQQHETPKPDKTPEDQPRRNPIEEAKIKATLSQMLMEQVSPCWSPPIGASYAEKLVVEIHIYLREDGHLIGQPEILDQARYNGDASYKVAADAARRAILRCSEQQGGFKLPIEYYDEWRDVTFNFDPSKMLF